MSESKMNSRVVSFGLGMALGATIIGFLFFFLSSNGKPASPNRPAMVEINATPSTVQEAATKSFDWRMVESEEYPKYIANLRAIGCPEETIRDIITADVNKLFDDRRKTLTGEITNRFEYWKPWARRSIAAYDETKVKAQQELANEKRAVLKVLLGIEPEEKLEILAPDLLAEMYDFLNPSKRREVVAIDQRFSARRIKQALNGSGLNRLAEIEKALDAEVAKLLSPAEMEEYRLRRSETAMRLTSQLEALEPSEQEFREIYKLRSQIEDELGVSQGGMLSSAANAKLEEGLKNLLGDSRYSDYELSQNYGYKKIYGVATLNGFGKDAATYVFNLKKESENQTKAVRMDSSLTPEQRAASLLSIRRVTEKAVRTVFDGEAFQSFHSQTSYWLNDISPDSQ